MSLSTHQPRAPVGLAEGNNYIKPLLTGPNGHCQGVVYARSEVAGPDRGKTKYKHMKTKDIEQIFAPSPIRWVGNGFKVHNFFPAGMDMQRMSPFFLLDYNAKMTFPPSEIPQGVGVHPHRGIETVTVLYHGRIAHYDSAGNGGVIGEGDIQWMTAGGGVLHREYHEETFNKRGGEFQMAHIWVNLPKKDKMTPPKYQALVHGQIPQYQLSNGKGNIEVIAGAYKGIKGIVSTFSPIEMYSIKLKKNGKVKISLPSEYNTGILVVKGLVNINDEKLAPANHFVLFANNGENIALHAMEDSILLLLSGQPLNEPIAAVGPFVMNTREEIMQAYHDFEEGKFGHLDDWKQDLLNLYTAYYLTFKVKCCP